MATTSDNSVIKLGQLKTFKNKIVQGNTVDLGASIAKGASTATIASANASALWAKLGKYSFPFFVQMTGTVNGDTTSTFAWVSQSQIKGSTSYSLNFEHMQGVILTDGSLASMQITVTSSSASIALSGTCNVALSNLKLNIR